MHITNNNIVETLLYQCRPDEHMNTVFGLVIYGNINIRIDTVSNLQIAIIQTTTMYSHR